MGATATYPPIRLLVVDDSAMDIDLSMRALAAARVEADISVARDGEQALDLLEAVEMKDRPNLIMLDLRMPRMDGFTMLMRLRAHPSLRYIPVVVLSCSMQEADVERSYECGATSYIVKPLVFADYVAIINRFWSYWAQTARLPHRN